jgi:hypothetical protein
MSLGMAEYTERFTENGIEIHVLSDASRFAWPHRDLWIELNPARSGHEIAKRHRELTWTIPHGAPLRLRVERQLAISTQKCPPDGQLIAGAMAATGTAVTTHPGCT